MQARAKRDPNIERYIEEWIEALTGEQLAPKGDLSESLKNGIMMCKYVHVSAACEAGNRRTTLARSRPRAIIDPHDPLF